MALLRIIKLFKLVQIKLKRNSDSNDAGFLYTLVDAALVQI